MKKLKIRLAEYNSSFDCSMFIIQTQNLIIKSKAVQKHSGVLLHHFRNTLYIHNRFFLHTTPTDKLSRQLQQQGV